jgi:hypothetical protein
MPVLPPPAPGCDACTARDAQLAVQQEELADLRVRVARLERVLSRNSGNSGMPPSGDDMPGRTPPRKQRRAADRAAKRKQGKQPGAPGAAMSWAVPDEVKDHYPAGRCGCGADLSGAADLGAVRSLQQLDIPLVTARRIQHDLHQARRGCGRVHTAAPPPGAPDSGVSVGPNLRAMAVYLVIFQHVPIERCRQLIADLTGARVSDGFIHSCLARSAAVIADVVKLIKTLITAAHVAGFDETTLRAGPAAGPRRYVHGAFTELYSLLFLGGRTMASMHEFGILPSFTGVVVSDRYKNYFHPDWKHIAGHQACSAHLLRDFQDAAESYPAAAWPAQAERSLRAMISAWHQAADAGQDAIAADVLEPLVTEFRRAITVGLASVPRVPGHANATTQHPSRDLLEFCRTREDDVLRFTTSTQVWPTNNISERGVRPLKTQQKISGRLTSTQTTQDRLDIRSYIDTARKHGQDTLTVLHNIMTGTPWHPPIPAATPP